MLKLISLLCLIPQLAFSDLTPKDPDEGFHKKLSLSIRNIEKSVKLIRKQISESQMAPFLPDLYLQLADLLSQKSLTLYYIQMEKDPQKEQAKQELQKPSSPVVKAQKEAIEVYKTLVHDRDFADYPKRSVALYKLAISYKAIDANTEFVVTTNRIIKEYPESEEAMKTKLLLGQHFFDQGDYEEAYTIFSPLSKIPFPYERNLAVYRIGLIYLAQEKFVLSLQSFERVVNDPELKTQDDPQVIGKKEENQKGDLKREALLDSVRVYTHVFKDKPDPVDYYSKLCPTEFYFQEVMEKLALRYIFLKQYDLSVRILRALSERSSDPQKILNVYRQVLRMIPPKERVKLPMEEMKFVLERLNFWWSFYHLKPEEYASTYWFFEQQIRELGTFSHESAKTAKIEDEKKHFLDRAKDYYTLYIQFFDNPKYTHQMATNLADVYFRMKDFLNAGDYYLRIFGGEYHPAPQAEKKGLIENAILCLQKPPKGSYYDRVRMKGRLIQAIDSYIRFNPALKYDLKLELLSIKARYEQGPTPQILEQLFAFAKRNSSKSQGRDAAELILDYFNTLNDFDGLTRWASRLSQLHFGDPAYIQHLAQIKTQSHSKMIEEKVKAVSNYDEFAPGKSYLAAALSSSDANLKNLALKQALANSKQEHDFKTFVLAATLVADKEKDKSKKAEILSSLAQEHVKLGRVYQGVQLLRKISVDGQYPQAARVQSVEQSLELALQLRDLKILQDVLLHPLASKMAQKYWIKARDQIADMWESPVNVPLKLTQLILQRGVTEDHFVSLFKAQDRIDPSSRSRLKSEKAARCSTPSNRPLCSWTKLETWEPKKNQMIAYLAKAPAQLNSVQTSAQPLMNLVTSYQTLEGSDDPHLEVIAGMALSDLFQAFASYLSRVAQKNPDVRADLMAKVNESLGSAAREQQKCEIIRKQSPVANPAVRFCKNHQGLSLRQMLNYPAFRTPNAPRSDSSSSETKDIEKAVFSPQGDPDALLRLSKKLYDEGRFYHVNAVASYGAGAYPQKEGDFKALLGCSTLQLGFYNEASYHLKSSTNYLNFKDTCLNQLSLLRQPRS